MSNYYLDNSSVDKLQPVTVSVCGTSIRPGSKIFCHLQPYHEGSHKHFIFPKYRIDFYIKKNKIRWFDISGCLVPYLKCRVFEAPALQLSLLEDVTPKPKHAVFNAVVMRNIYSSSTSITTTNSYIYNYNNW